MKSIHFKPNMINAILDGRKTMTRRIIKHKFTIEDVRPVMRCIENENDWGKYILTDENGEDFLIKPKYQPGDIVYVKEAFAIKTPIISDQDWESYGYKADGYELHRDEKWKSPLLMSEKAARVFLEITDVKAERLNVISEEDAIAEGIEKLEKPVIIGYPFAACFNFKGVDGNYTFAKEAFKSLWQSIHGPDSFDNRWVWVYTFKTKS